MKQILPSRGQAPRAPRTPLEPVQADPARGLEDAQVRERMETGWVSGQSRPAGKTESQIVTAHIFTFFNLIFLILAVMLALAGSTVKNMTFLMVAACNTAIGIFQEIRAKRAVDALTLVAARPVPVVRAGEVREIPPDMLVRDEIAIFRAGDQICADGILRQGSLQVDESLLTGESDPVAKAAGDQVLSGSVVLSGQGRVQLTAVGEDSFAAGLAREARADPGARKSEMMKSLDRLIRVVGYALIPVGTLLLWQEHWQLGLPFRESVEGVVAALVGMIPEGLYLLTSIALAVSARKLTRERVLVQDMNCIEALARVDVLCVDKTGTITQPTMEVQELIPLTDDPPELLETVLAALFSTDAPDNETARALAELYGREKVWPCARRFPFSSVTKWSGGVFPEHGTFLAGAPEFLMGSRFPELEETIRPWADRGCRVLLIVSYAGEPEQGGLVPERVTPLALILLSSPIRENARDVFAYFRQEGVSVRVISGDSPVTVSRVAMDAGIPGADAWVDVSTLETEEDFRRAAESCRVFGRVTPERKKRLVAAMQAAGHTVAMTGDGVNDLLAMKQADCSVAMASGAQAASRSASLVLLDSDFGAMPGIVAEGRRVINNIQRSAVLFLVKNIFSAALALVSFLTGLSYPLMPLHLTLVSCMTIGIPSFFLALEPNYTRVSGKFLRTVLRRALSGGLTDLILVLAAQVFGLVFRLSDSQVETLSSAALGIVGLLVLWKVSRPFNIPRGILWGCVAAGLTGCFLLLGSFFQLDTNSLQSNLLLCSELIMAPTVLRGVDWLLDRLDGIAAKTRRKKQPCAAQSE